MAFKLDLPDQVTLVTERGEHLLAPAENMTFQDVSLALSSEDDGLKIEITADRTPLNFLFLRWDRRLPENALFLGDAWERTYGDLQWRTHDPSRMMPWYFLMHEGTRTAGFGVRVRPGSFALWTENPSGIALWLDLRNGSRGVLLNNRTLHAATVVSAEYDGISAFQAAREFCAKLCSDPLRPPFPVYGGNNWYYAYGNTSHKEVLEDCDCIASFCEGLENRPFMVLDDGWEVLHRKPGNSGPWDRGNERFPDMPRLAAEMRERGVRPGIWFRPLWNLDPAIPESLLLAEKNGYGHRFLDPSQPGALEIVQNDIRRIAGWGFELIKHDFSTWDIFGGWGFQMRPWPAGGDWTFADRSRTSAEIIVALYRAILDAAGDALILGCNTIGHLGAGLMHLSRIGDDTSGKRWDRTRKMGINTLAFRLCQHRTFFDIDADCVGIMGNTIPWELNLQWAELLAKSGTPFFASIRPGVLSRDQHAALKPLFAAASKGESSALPLDWLHSTTPSEWKLDGELRRFDWFSDTCGGLPEFLPQH